MGWRDTDVWLDPKEVVWFERPRPAVRAAVRKPLLARAQLAPAYAASGSGALPPARPRALPERARSGPSRRRRLATRLFPTAVGVLAIAAAVPMYLLRPEAAVTGGRAAVPSAEAVAPREDPVARLAGLPLAAVAADLAGRSVAEERERGNVAAEKPKPPYGAVAWRDSRAVGVPHAGRLVAGVRLPRSGPDWVTWDPALNRVPNRANRLYGTDRLVRMVLDVLTAYRAANPGAPRVVIGDLSRRGGGEIDEHASHENGLDVDVYYPRRDGKLKPPRTAAQVDLRLSQDLLDRFRAAGAQVVFVGYSVPLRGPRGTVVPYPAHDNHMHVRIARG